MKTSLLLWLKVPKCHVEILWGPRWLALLISKISFWHSCQPSVTNSAQIPGRNGKQDWSCCPVPTYQYFNLKRKPYCLYLRQLNSRRWHELPFLQSYRIAMHRCYSPKQCMRCRCVCCRTISAFFSKACSQNSHVIATSLCASVNNLALIYGSVQFWNYSISVPYGHSLLFAWLLYNCDCSCHPLQILLWWLYSTPNWGAGFVWFCNTQDCCQSSWSPLSVNFFLDCRFFITDRYFWLWLM